MGAKMSNWKDREGDRIRPHLLGRGENGCNPLEQKGSELRPIESERRRYADTYVAMKKSDEHEIIEWCGSLTHRNRKRRLYDNVPVCRGQTTRSR